MFRKISISVFFITILHTGFSQLQWQLSKDQNGIKVYTAKEASSKFKEIKVEATLEGTIQKLENILINVGKTKGWVYGTKDSYIIKKISPNEILYYSETSLPWPVSNRDIPIKMVLTPDARNNTLKVVATGIPDAIPEKKGIVRLPYFNATWDVKSEGKNKLNITYLLKMDPGGSVPAGVTNLFVSKGPFETFNNLSELLKQ
ncbi:MAG: START domain-containing protein [Bacteroidota bacterium]|nr:START domain-containing protein [Bacteroidota bacterium]